MSALLVACTVPVAIDLGEEDANRSIVALERAGVPAEKAPDPKSEGRWQIAVLRGDSARAAEVLSEESLPPPRAPGVLAALGEGGLVPSRIAEHARLVAGTAGELEQSLRAVDGIVSARVHLAVPATDPLALETPQQASASVLLRHRGADAPLPAAAVQELVAGAVIGLDPGRVSVVATPLRAEDAARARHARGVLGLPHASLGTLRLVAGTAILLDVALILAVASLWLRLRRAKHDARVAEVPGAAP